MTTPPWREITADDFLRSDPTETSAAQAALLEAQHQGAFRLRLVLREATDLKSGPNRDPLWLLDYEFGPRAIVLGAEEVIIEERTGQRHLVTAPKRWDEVAIT